MFVKLAIEDSGLIGPEDRDKDLNDLVQQHGLHKQVNDMIQQLGLGGDGNGLPRQESLAKRPTDFFRRLSPKFNDLLWRLGLT